MGKNPAFYDGRRYDPQQSVGFQIAQLMGQMRREVERRMARHEITDAQWKPLWMIKSGIATTANELAREGGIDAGAVTRMVDRLEAKGLVERVRSEDDRRVVRLVLTAAGEAAAARIPAVLAAVNNDFLAGFTATDLQTLQKLIGRMRDNGSALQAEAEVQA